MGGVMRTASPVMPFWPFTVITRPGTESPVIGVDSNGPTANATRYEGIGGDVLNVTVAMPPCADRLASGVLASTIRSCGAVRVSVQGILNSGSSQQGNACRASVDSNWVNPYQ